MRKINISTKAKKELIKLKQNKKFNIDEFNMLINMIAAGQPLPAKYYDHKLSKSSREEYLECRDFHFRPNICVVYRLLDDYVEIRRVGSHQDLRLTENL